MEQRPTGVVVTSKTMLKKEVPITVGAQIDSIRSDKLEFGFIKNNGMSMRSVDLGAIQLQRGLLLGMFAQTSVFGVECIGRLLEDGAE